MKASGNGTERIGRLDPKMGRQFVEDILEKMNFSFVGGRASGLNFLLEAVRTVEGRKEKAMVLVLIDPEIDLPRLNGERGIIFDLRSLKVSPSGWEVVSPKEMVEMARALKVEIPGREDVPKPVSAPSSSSSESSYLPSVGKLESDMNWGREFYDEGNYEKALEYFQKVIDTKPNYVDAWRMKAKTLTELERYDLATSAYKEVVNKEPSDEESWFELGQAHREQGMREEELHAYERSLAIDPENWRVWLERGKTMWELSMDEEADLCFKKAEELSGDPGVVKREWGKALLESEDYQGAEAMFREVLSLKPDDEETRLFLVNLLRLDERSSEAVQEMKKLISANAENVKHLKTLGYAQEEAGEMEEAFSTFQKASIIDPTDEESREQVERIRNYVDIHALTRKKKKKETPEDSDKPQPSAKDAEGTEEAKKDTGPEKGGLEEGKSEKTEEDDSPKEPLKDKTETTSFEDLLNSYGELSDEETIAEEPAPVEETEERTTEEAEPVSDVEELDLEDIQLNMTGEGEEPPSEGEEADVEEEMDVERIKEEYICFGDFDEEDPDCAICEIKERCIRYQEETGDEVDYSEEFVCFGDYEEGDDDCEACPVKEKCKAKVKED